MTLHQLKILVSIAKCQSITKAARELHISQPSVTGQIKLLEKEYRVTLYNRNGRGIELTKRGKLFAQKSKRILSHVENLKKGTRSSLKQRPRHR